MSVQIWWQERLTQRCPVASQKIREDGYSLRPRRGSEDTWPHAVSRSALFDDYVEWHQDTYLGAYREVEYYRENPDRMPHPADELTFFSTIAPWLYIVGKKQQVRSYMVPKMELYEGRWYEVKTARYFVRLLEHEAHEAAFLIATGVSPSAPVAYYEPQAASTLDRHQGAYTDRITEARERMERGMTKGGLTDPD